MEPEVITRVEGVAGRITLNRPKALNSLNADMCLAISEALLAWHGDPHVALVVIDAAGERAFCAGGDIRVVAESGAGDGREARRFFHAEYRMNELLHRYPKPVVAIMDGITMGGGVGISAPARWRVATEKTLWAMPEGDIGLFPDVGGGWHLPRLPGEAGAWLALSGARLKAADCRALGIATHFVPSRELEALKAELSVGGSLDPFDEDPGPAPISPIAEAVDRLFAAGTVEEIMESLAAYGSDWARAQRDILAKKCPATLKVALKLIREGAVRDSFVDEMRLEYRIAVRMTRRHDFIEGVRAVIVDKDGAPRWDPADLGGVTDAMLDEIFAPLPPAEEWTPLP
jgi:enoyl-CoA hydratase